MSRPSGKKDKVVELLLARVPYKTISRELHCSMGTIAYHADILRTQGMLPPKRILELSDRDWSEIQGHYDSGKTGLETKIAFGLTRTRWETAVRNGKLRLRKQSPDDVSQLTHRGSVKKRLIKEGILEDKCGECGLTHWRGEKLSLHTHHKNGQSGDHKTENIILLCPNCHSITDNYAGRNKGISGVPGAKIRLDRQK